MASTPNISSDTTATLLLTARLGARGDTSAEPLTLGEYNQLAVKLGEAGMRPADLLEPAISGFVAQQDAVDARRLIQLLERSMAVAVAVENWTNAGLWVISRADETYPSRMRERLRGKAPALLFGCGELSLLEVGGLAIVGSRNVDEAGGEFTRVSACAAAATGIQVVSGGARGVDSIAMQAALERGGTVVGVLANDLSKTSRSSMVRQGVSDGRLCLVSPSQPESHFEAWRAMDRNKSIYALSDWALVVSTDLRKGGTWAGAKENLGHGWVPLFVRIGDGVPAGNEALVPLGAQPVHGDWPSDMGSTLRDHDATAQRASADDEFSQPSLF